MLGEEKELVPWSGEFNSWDETKSGSFGASKMKQSGGRFVGPKVAPIRPPPRPEEVVEGTFDAGFLRELVPWDGERRKAPRLSLA